MSPIYYNESTTTDTISKIAKWIIEIIVAIALAGLVIWSFGGRVRIDGHSMEPALKEGDTVLINRLEYHFSDVDRFDIITITGGEEEDDEIVKRVVGLPGETVQIVGGQVLIDGKPLVFPVNTGAYTVAGLAEEPFLLKDSEYFVLGDNGDSSEDSRFSAVGAIPRERITGRIWFRVTPLRTIGPVD